MIKTRKSLERGQANHGWLKSFHTFSFANYYDPSFMGFGSLRVINEDFIAPFRGFGAHPHRDMEIITYLIKGNLQHEDSMGNKSIIREGEIQIMSAGSGVMHSEINPSHEEAHLLQIWITPNKKNVVPRYEQKSFKQNENLTLLLSPNGDKDSFKIYQDAFLYRGVLKNKEDFSFDLNTQRKYWVQIVQGDVESNGIKLSSGDAIILEKESKLEISSHSGAEFLLFDLA